MSVQSLESARGESGEGGIGEDEVDKLNQELKDMRDSLAEKSKKLTERTEGAAKYDGFSLWVKMTYLEHIECFHSHGQHLCKFMGTKESICIRKEFNSHRTGLGHQHGHRFIVVGHQYGHHDIM